MKKEYLFTVIGQEIYLLDQTLDPNLLSKNEFLILLETEEEIYMYTRPITSDAVWLNILRINEFKSHHQLNFLNALSQLWYFFNQSMIEQISDMPKENIIFYPGSFNPWHDGHATCVLKALNFGNVMILPDRNPNKAQNRTRHLLKEYLELCQQIKLQTGLGPMRVGPKFLLSEEKNPTYHWVNQIHQNYPDLWLRLLMGFDSFKTLPTWIEAEKLICLLNTVYVLSRNESKAEFDLACAQIKEINPKLEVVSLGHHRFEKISSSALRRRAQTSELSLRSKS
jgi:nicotinic acid mononucleotide adenylyltransferase